MHIYKKKNDDREIYIAADLNFCQSKERDKTLINNWNLIVKENDLVILLGDIINGQKYNWIEIQQIFDSLKGEKEIISISSDEDIADKWKNILGHTTHKVTAAVKGKINGMERVIIIYPYLTPSIKNKDFSDTEIYSAAPRSITKQSNIFEDNIMSISIDDWGLFPIKYKNIPLMIDDILVFEKMEDTEENIDEQKNI